MYFLLVEGFSNKTKCCSSLHITVLQMFPIKLEVGKWACPVCSKIFKRAANVRDHFMIHTDQKPFKCPKCGYAARQKSNLRKHMDNGCSFSGLGNKNPTTWMIFQFSPYGWNEIQYCYFCLKLDFSSILADCSDWAH